MKVFRTRFLAPVWGVVSFLISCRRLGVQVLSGHLGRPTPAAPFSILSFLGLLFFSARRDFPNFLRPRKAPGIALCAG